MNIISELRDLLKRVNTLEKSLGKLPSRISAGGGGGSANQTEYVRLWKAPSIELLENSSAVVKPYDLGFITEGDEKSAWYERNEDNDNWQGRTIWK